MPLNDLPILQLVSPVWISGPTSSFEIKARELIRSRATVRNQPRQASLTEAKKAALHHEQSRNDRTLGSPN